MPVWLVVAATLAYTAGLFVLAWRRDRRARRPGFTQSPTIYALALGVYCTSWTYFGAVGTASASGWDYLPIYLGPIITYLFAWRFVERLARISRRESTTSLSDFLAARYGKSRGVGALAALAALIGSLPYIALQLQSIGQSFTELTDLSGTALSTDGLVLLIAVALAAFAILFGARSADTTASNAGLMRVLAFESVIKLAALLAVCLLSVTLLSGPTPLPETITASNLGAAPASGRFLSITVLAMIAVLCLPRQFHVANIEWRSERELKQARWAFPLYLLLTSLVVIPIALAGTQQFGGSVTADMYVLALPLSEGDGLLALLVFLGGFSASSSMVIVATIALSTMLSNDLLVPAALRPGRRPGGNLTTASPLALRRLSCVGILLLAWGYYQLAGGTAVLAEFGLLSFAATAQFAPALLGALLWRGGQWQGVCLGLSAGMLVWAHTLLLPSALGDTYLQLGFPALLEPHGLFGAPFSDPLTHGVVMSLTVNALLYVLGSVLAQRSLVDQVQAVAFTERQSSDGYQPPESLRAHTATPAGLQALAARFLEAPAVDQAFRAFEVETGIPASGSERADWRLVSRTEKLLAAALGAPSARLVMASALRGSEGDLDDVLSVFSSRDRDQLFNQHMLQSMLENIDQGISVVDHEQRLVAWNDKYVELFGYPAALLKIGQPIGDLISYNTRTGWLDAGGAEAQAQRRVAHMRAGTQHVYERRSPAGTWLRIAGNPMPGGGYVTTFTDITKDKAREQALIEANESLETRVEERTQALKTLTEELREARREADRANASKTRFLAAASHDLLQPLNAARLFLGAIDRHKVDADADQEALHKADKAIRSADDLLTGLLDITRLDHGAPQPEPEVFPIAPFLEELVEEATPMAEAAGLSIRLAPSRLHVRTDANYLQSIVRNFISNAHRYTRRGGILVGARRAGDQVRIEVCDTGPGIPEDQVERLFEEFARLEDVDNQGLRGAGLGLSVAHRLAALCGARIDCRSRVGRGTVFSVSVPRADAPGARASSTAVPGSATQPADALKGLRCLCLDDEETVLDGLRMLLESCGCHVACATDLAGARRLLSSFKPDVVIADLQLKDHESGLTLLREAQARPHAVNTILITANSAPTVKDQCERLGIRHFRKPVDSTGLLAAISPANAA
ncbi:MAG: PAS domain-containing hybrid sensor histidine kinase/response regulator [Pseudomonadota bacterium]